MCKKLVYLASFVLVLGLASSAFAGLHAHYTFDGGEEANDVSGNDYHGTLANLADVIADPCSEMTGMVLDLNVTAHGPQDYVVLPIGVTLPSGDPKTICMFLNVRDFRSWARIYYAYNYPNGQIVSLGTGDKIGGTLSKGDDGGPMTSAGVVVEGEWHHVCLINDGSDTAIYWDGVLQFSAAEGFSFIAEGAVLGCQYGGGGASNPTWGFFDGMVDDIRVYDEAITELYLERIIGGDFESAWNPSPENGADTVAVDVLLSWNAGESADSHTVYFGTSESNVTDADDSIMADPCDANFVWAEYKGNQAEPNYPLGILEFNTTYYWRIDECNTVSGLVEGSVWSFTTTGGKAHEPIYPENGEEVEQPLLLTWTPCYGVVSHDVYIGRFVQAVAVADHDSDEYMGNWDDPNFSASTLNMGAIYYWRVDEIYPGDVTVAGDVWQFSIAPSKLIEDFEDYDSDGELRDAWGGGTNYPESAAYLYIEKFDGAEETDQSMRIWYANQYSPYYSEGYLTELGHTESTWDPWTQTGEIIYIPLDMTAGRGGAIDLYWHGEPGNDDGVMYVALEDADGNCVAATYEPNRAAGDPNFEATEWQILRIEIEEFSDGGLDLTEVNNIYVGVGDRFSPVQESVEGKLWVDQIRLHPPRCLAEYAIVGDITGDCKVNEKDLLVMTQDWLDCDFYEYIPVTEPCEANLVCLYTFETADGTDSGPHGLDAIRGGNAHVAAPNPADAARGDWVLELTTDWVDELIVPHDPVLQLSEQITIAGWINPSTVASWRTIISKWPYKRMYILVVNGNLRITLNGATSNNWYGTDGAPIVADTWQHFAITNDGTTLRTYLDGEYQKSAAITGLMTLGTSEDDMCIGSNLAWSETFLGQMDEICIYDYGLPIDEVLSTAGYVGSKETYLPVDSTAELYSLELQGSRSIDQNDFAVMAEDWGENSGFGGEVEDLPEPPELAPWAWWDFENQDATDRAANEFHGTLLDARIVNDLERGYVLECDSSNNEYVILPLDILLPDATPKSVSWWMKADGTQGWRGILNAKNGSNQMRIGIADWNPKSITASLNSSQYRCYNSCFEDGVWAHICVTSTGVGDQFMYANGVLKTDGWNDYLGAWADGVAVMGKRAGGTSYYNGRLDDVRMYDWRLTVPEIMMIYNEPPPVRPRGWWTFEGNVDDVSGNDANSILYPGDGTASLVTDPVMGNVAEFGGGYVEVIQDVPLAFTDAITLTAWIRPDDDWWNTIISNEPLKSIYWFTEGIGGQESELCINFNPPRGWSNWGSGITIDTDGATWTHVAVSYDGSMLRAYKNVDEAYAETAVSGDLALNNGQELYIGATRTSIWGEDFNGRMDDVRIYNWALSEEELQAVYDAQAP